MDEKDKKALRELTREVRNATGMERTPDQVLHALKLRSVGNISVACRKIIDDRDMVLAFARHELPMRGQDDIPSSVDLGM